VPTANLEVKTVANEQHFKPTNFETLPDLNDIVVYPSETGGNSYDCLLEAILLPIQYRDVFVGLRSPWKGGDSLLLNENGFHDHFMHLLVLLYGPPGTGKRTMTEKFETL
jgi:hypothetical protein